LVAGPIFKEVADKVYANSLEMHQELGIERHYANSAIPYSKHGSKKSVEEIFQQLDIPIESNAQDAEWIVTATQDSSVKIAPRKIPDKLVPNVVGMGLRDAVYLLENRGLNVVINGSGMVKKQSVQAGSPAENGQEIELTLS